MMADENGQEQASFGAVRDVAVRVAQVSLLIDAGMLNAVVAEAAQALESGVIDPMVYGDGGAPSLRRQLEFMRTFQTWRNAIEEFAEAEA